MVMSAEPKMTQLSMIHAQQGGGAVDNSSENQKHMNETRVPDDIEAATWYALV
jgi:hypothetical protein